MVDITDRYKDMIDSFECDFNVALNDSLGITWLTQMLKRIRNNEKLMKKDEQFLKDLDLLSELSFNLRHGLLFIVSKEEKKQKKKVNRTWNKSVSDYAAKVYWFFLFAL